MTKRATARAFLLIALFAAGAVAQDRLADTVHNLASSGPGAVKESGVTELCVFCHTPHNAEAQRGLWNRELPASSYNIYESSTSEAMVNQPTGASRLCLSCHDGTIALGNLRSPPRTGRASLGALSGRTSLGTNLSDDHPVSFVYDAALASRRRELAVPAALPRSVKLDHTGQMQCTTCHDPHKNPYRMFLTRDDRAGELCLTCHTDRDWLTSSHATSQARWSGGGSDPWPASPYDTVADNGCQNCHRTHAAPRSPRLLSDGQEHRVCLDCHDRSVAGSDIESDFISPSAHPVDVSDWSHDPREVANTMSRHVSCVDCHNPHKTNSVPASAPRAQGLLRGTAGINQGGVAVSSVDFEYEVCFKCHGVRDQATPLRVVRADNDRNARSELDQGNPSHHAVTAIGRNSTMSGFEPGYSVSSINYCTDCHDAHGSQFSPMLKYSYEMNDVTPESFLSYELCYTCHNRGFLINDMANTFPHRIHVQGQNAPCAVCHDAHGSRQNEHLINFMRVDPSGNVVVSESISTGRLEYVSGPGAGTGECYLACHGVDHAPLSYP
jgi:predicted CXXCH cytochrome family protein